MNSFLSARAFIPRLSSPGGVNPSETVATLGHVRGGTESEEGGKTTCCLDEFRDFGGVREADVERRDTTSEGQKALYEVQTFYERMFLSQGYKITYLAFTIDHEGSYKHPEAFDSDYWRSIEGPRRFVHSPASSQR